MAKRHEDWNVGLAEDLRDPEFAREFLLGVDTQRRVNGERFYAAEQIRGQVSGQSQHNDQSTATLATRRPLTSCVTSKGRPTAPR
jgi:hypothetical protein